VGKITLTPEEFTLVYYDAGEIVAVAERIAALAGLEGDIHLEVNESSPLGRLGVRSLDPIEVWVQGGAFEDPRRPRHLSERSLAETLGRLFFRVKDRLDTGFAEAPEEDKLTLQQRNVWDTYSLGRLARAGYNVAKPRWLYHFRSRQGFTDVADEAFERIWTSDGLTWSDLEAVLSEAAEARAA
jgi:hypothetical protein